MKNEQEIRYADLFGGVGGFRLGIERTNDVSSNKFQGKERGRRMERERTSFEKSSSISSSKNRTNSTKLSCVFYNDNDKYAVQTYNKNFGEKWEATDIRTIKTDSIPEIDMLCGGFPCQAFSIAGKRRGFNDTRGTLFFEIAKIIKAKRPKIVFLENVKGLLNHQQGQTFSIILNTLWELGYDVQWMVLNSKFFGVPQNRERVFIIGSLRGTSRPEILPFRGGSEEINCKTIMDINQAQRVYDTEGTSIALKGLGGGQGAKTGLYMMDLYNKKTHSDRSPALTEPHHNTLRVQEGMKIRRLTPIECERLQGFPDGWTEGVSDTQRYKQMGNAVTINVIQAIASKLFAKNTEGEQK
jgi:DNA (cytosine-5)-methyltransferase 1